MTDLSPGQLECLRLYDELGSAPAVARRLGISEQRVKNQLSTARKRLGGFRWTIEAVWAARAKGLIR